MLLMGPCCLKDVEEYTTVNGLREKIYVTGSGCLVVILWSSLCFPSLNHYPWIIFFLLVSLTSLCVSLSLSLSLISCSCFEFVIYSLFKF